MPPKQRTKATEPMTTTAAPAPASTGFGEKLRRLRKVRGWSQDELGAQVGIHGRHIGKYEAGKVLPNAETLLRIARLLQVSIDYLLRDEVSDAGDPQAALHDPLLLKQFSAVENMDDHDRDVVTSLIDAYIKKAQIEGVMKE